MGDLVGAIRGWLHRLWGTVSRHRPDNDLEEELRVHLDLAIEEARRRGIPASHAARFGRIEAGGSLHAPGARPSPPSGPGARIRP